MRRDITFNSAVAERYSVDVAILVHSVAYWVHRNEANGKVQADGLGWTYNSYKAWAALYPFWSRDQVKRVLRQAKDWGALKAGNFNQRQYDRTMWYCITDEVRAMYNQPHAEGKAAESIGQIGPMERAEAPHQYQVDNTGTNTSTSIPLPWADEAFVEAWELYRKDRADRGKRMTTNAELLQLKKLTSLTQDPNQAVRIIAQSIERGWTGLFALKNDRNNPAPTGDGSKLRAHLQALGQDSPS